MAGGGVIIGAVGVGRGSCSGESIFNVLNSNRDRRRNINSSWKSRDVLPLVLLRMYLVKFDDMYVDDLTVLCKFFVHSNAFKK